MTQAWQAEVVEIDYTNWRGERSVRRIKPLRLFFGKTEHHVTDQWLLDAFDYGKDAERTFSIKDVHAWRPVT